MSPWVATLLAGVGCFALRFGAVTFVERRPLPVWVERASAFVVPGSLAGLCAVLLFVPIASGDAGLAVALAGITTALIARRRSSAFALLCGMSVVWVAALLG